MVIVNAGSSTFYKPCIKFDKKIIIPIFFLCIFLGKLIRFTIMKDTLLVNSAIGNEWLKYINSGNTSFTFFPESFDYKDFYFHF